MPPRSPAWLRPGVQAMLLFAILNGCMCHEPLVIRRQTDTTWFEPSDSLLTGGAAGAPGGPCEDADGDGYGVGAGCLGPDCDDADPALGANGTRSCYTGPAGTRDVGACASGTETCKDGVLSACSGDVWPGEEVCDGLDNDCDGEVDEALVRTCYGGPDGTDGVGACHGGQQTCAAGDWGACAGEVTPQAETCDGVDNNCDGQADEELVRSCYDGPTGTAGVGACVAGTQTCTRGAYGACVGEVLPGTETCDAVDNDCDGAVDEELVRTCYDGPARTAGVGVCAAGTQTCTNGMYGTCAGQVLPGEEVCDAQDNDCDGEVDERLVRSCYDGPSGTDGVGLCHGGTQTCSNGAYGACVAEVTPVAETCDRQDNDCDGQADEEVTRSCYTGPSGTEGVGACRAGSQACTRGDFGTCTGEVTPTLEVCDGIDNDCDGEVDEDLVRSCYDGPSGTDGVGVCHGGSQTCAAGAWGACSGQVLPTAEVCDAQDNDCDGTPDEQLVRSCYGGPSGTEDVGLCHGGTQTCSAGAWSTCAGQVMPEAEACDGQDNDCDGALDEQLVRSCYDGPSGTDGVGVCHGGSQTCGAGAWGACTGQTLPGTETCDALDNDCNGQVDEQLVRACYGGPAGTQDVGVCHGGNQTCSAGSWGTCSGEVTPSTETCDGQDNDCDGQLDEQLVRSCYQGPAGTDGVGLCHGGSQTCAAGTWGACAGQVLPTTEVCDALDNDCDSQVDEQVFRACYDGPPGTEGVGVCHGGTQACSVGSWGECTGEATPGPETCDAQDNNCDGTADELLFRACYQGPAGTEDVGVCHGGTQACVAGDWGTCGGQVTPGTEVCDALDNDCDGQMDEQLVQACYGGPAGTNGVGVCHGGSQTCAAGTWGTCEGEVQPTPEACDDLDNDCDGARDEQLVRACYTGPAGTESVGVCRSGSETCAAGAWGACTGAVTPTPESCDNLDNDCDGTVDDNLVKACYTGPAGTEGVGICRAGNQMCAAGSWGACNGQVLPATETCDTRDNNCNKSTDENVTRYRHEGGNESPLPPGKQVDLIIVVDNSGGMKDEIIAVEQNLNTSLAQVLGASGLDYRIILVSKHSPDSSAQGLCIHQPLSGNDCSDRNTCPIYGPRFFHYNHEISNDDPLRVLTQTYNAPDGCGATQGWSMWLRPSAARYFLLITDGERSGVNASDISADAFEAALYGMVPASFGTSPADRNFRFHLIGGLHQPSPADSAWLPADPLQTTVCTGTQGVKGDGEDRQYQSLSRRSGGLRFAICAYPKLGAMFERVAQSIIGEAADRCSFVVRSVPPDSSMQNAYGAFLPTNGGGATVLPHVADGSTCAGNGFYNDGTTVFLCPASCDLWMADPTAIIELLFTCSNQVGVPH